MRFACVVSLHILSLLTSLYDSRWRHRWKARGFSSACKTTICFKLAWFFIRKQQTIGRDLSGLDIENNRRARTSMYETKHAPEQKMHIFIHGNTAAGKNETGCGTALQGNCASNSRTRQKPEYFLRRIYLCQLTGLTSISSLESRHTHTQWDASFHHQRRQKIGIFA